MCAGSPGKIKQCCISWTSRFGHAETDDLIRDIAQNACYNKNIESQHIVL